MIEIRVEGHLYIIQAPKCTLVVLSRDQFIQALRRGKWWKRTRQFQARHPKEEV